MVGLEQPLSWELIKTIIFDLGKVIIPFDFQRAYQRIAPVCAYSPAQIPERLRGTNLVNRFECGAIEPEPFFEQFSQILELNVGFDEFQEIWGSIFLPETLVPASLIAALRERYRMLVLSNTNVIHFELVRQKYPIIGLFHDHVLSYRVGAMKPDAAIYEEAVRRAECAPAECFFTDDIPAYVEGARAHGIDAVQFQNAEQIESELRSRGVQWEEFKAGLA